MHLPCIQKSQFGLDTKSTSLDVHLSMLLVLPENPVVKGEGIQLCCLVLGLNITVGQKSNDTKTLHHCLCFNMQFQ